MIGTTMEQDKQGHIISALEELGTFHPEGSYWYLPLIGVDPMSRGLGVGSALLRTALAVCDDDGLPAYLESTNPRNVSLYERHGFKVVGQVQHGTCPAFTPMVRESQ